MFWLDVNCLLLHLFIICRQNLIRIKSKSNPRLIVWKLPVRGEERRLSNRSDLKRETFLFKPVISVIMMRVASSMIMLHRRQKGIRQDLHHCPHLRLNNIMNRYKWTEMLYIQAQAVRICQDCVYVSLSELDLPRNLSFRHDVTAAESTKPDAFKVELRCFAK